MRRKLMIGVSAVVGIIIFFLVIRTVGFQNILTAFAEANKYWLIVFIMASVAVPLTLILRWDVILISHNVHIPFWKLFLFRLAGFSVGYLTPSAQMGGDPLRALLLRREKVPTSIAFSSVLIDKSLEMGTNLTFAVIGFIFILLTLTVTTNSIIVITIALLAAIGLLFLFYYRILNDKGVFSSAYRMLNLNRFLILKRYENHIREVEISIAKFFKFNRTALKAALALSLISWIFMFIEYETALLTFNFDPSITTLFLVITVMGAAYMVPIPAALGVLEGGQASLFRLLQVSATKGVALGLLIRVRDIGWVVVGVFYLFNYGWSISKKKLLK
jgi:uncharacterized protein (TIRG00374 family)